MVARAPGRRVGRLRRRVRRRWGRIWGRGVRGGRRRLRQLVRAGLSLQRTLRHLFTTHWQVRRHFPAAVLDEIERTVREVEAHHCGEIRFVVEAALEGQALFNDITPRTRAWQIFGQLGVWDTANNNGVLLYVLFADHA